MQERYSNAKDIECDGIILSYYIHQKIKLNEKYIIIQTNNKFYIYNINNFKIFKILYMKNIKHNIYTQSDFYIIDDDIYYLSVLNKKYYIIKYNIISENYLKFKIYDENFYNSITRILHKDNILYIYNNNHIYKFNIDNYEIEIIEFNNIPCYTHSLCNILFSDNLMYCCFDIYHMNDGDNLYLTDFEHSFFHKLNINFMCRPVSTYSNIITNFYNDIILVYDEELIIYNNDIIAYTPKQKIQSNVVFNDNYILYTNNKGILIKETFPNFYSEIK